MAKKDDHLFPELNRSRYGDAKIHRKLFLPKLLESKSRNKQVTEGEAYEKAYQIIIKWADLESSGKLEEKKETMLEGEFIGEVFGEALGYTQFSKNKEKWEIEAKFRLNGGEADAAIGLFEHGRKNAPLALIELKGPKTNVDRDRFNGRTPVQQCWDYLNDSPESPWGIVCNYVSFRLYHRKHTTRAYEHFALQELRKKDEFRKFYYIFQRDGLLPTCLKQPRSDFLLEISTKKEREVGDKLYDYYNESRINLIQYLKGYHNKTLEESIRIAQKLLDRVIFIAFCEDRGLLPGDSLKKAWEKVPPFSRVTNPRWKNFVELFRSIDKGNPNADIAPYNGGLFKEDPEVDDLELDDNNTNFFKVIGSYDFHDEINVEVLGHLFERSVHDIERIRYGGLFGQAIEPDKISKMRRSAERKKFGIYYTPKDFTEFITYKTISRIADQRFNNLAEQMGIDRARAETSEGDPEIAEYWNKCFDILRKIKIVDPACGSGAFLIKAYDILADLYSEVLHHITYQGQDTDELREQVPDIILRDNIHGVDLSRESVEITQLALWIRSAVKGRTLSDLSKNIVCGNSLIDDENAHPQAMKWEQTFPQVFSRSNKGFDCVIGNPPWERMKLQEREFFDGRDAEIATAVNAATRRRLIEKLEQKNPELYALYIKGKEQADANLEYTRKSGRYPLTGKGDINTYAVFAELAHTIVAPEGIVGILVPSGIATDKTTKNFFACLVDSKALVGFYDFENRKKIFPDVDGRFKFSALIFGGSGRKTVEADFVFFAHRMDELKDKNRHILLSSDDIKLMNPNTLTCPVFRSNRDAEITKAIYRRVPVLINRNRDKGGNPWGIKFNTMFHQTNDAELFHTAEQLKAKRFKRVGPNWEKGRKAFVPLYEAKMIQMYDHRAASVVVKDENWFRQGQTNPTSLVSYQNPEFTVEPRWWAAKDVVEQTYGEELPPAFLAFKNVTSPTNRRTMIAAFIPAVGVINSAPLITFTEQIDVRLQCCLLANLASFVLDYVARQKIGNVNLNFFLIEQFPMFHPAFYADTCPWSKKQSLETWISDRVLKLSCTSNDMIPFAEAASFKPRVYRWKPDERADLQAQLDAAYFLLYQIEREDVEYILSTFAGVTKEGKSFFGTSPSELILKHYDSLRTKCKAED